MPQQPLERDQYVTCIDLGKWGALFTQGWERKPTLTGQEGKEMKHQINWSVIYPPANREALFAVARPAVVRARVTGSS